MGCGASTSKTPLIHVKPADSDPGGDKLGPLPERTFASSSTKSIGSSKRTRLQSIIDFHGYPPPYPPGSRKADIFCLEDHKEVDEHVTNVPVEYLYKSFEELVEYLLRPARNDVGRCRALFRWLTSVDVGEFQHTLDELPDKNTPLEALLKIKFNMGNHAYLFSTLCRHANLPNVILTGINKSAAYQLGSKLDWRRLAAQWNAVLLDGKWRLVDVFWACTVVVGRKSREWTLVEAADDEEDEDADEDEEERRGKTYHRINEFFFLPDPDHLIATHFPEEREWQLLNKPLTAEEFETIFYHRERFFDIGMTQSNKSHAKCTVECQTGEMDISFSVKKKESRKAQYKYLLYRSKDQEAAEARMDRFVLFTKQNSSVNFNIRFPTKGRYKLDVFGKDPERHESFDLVFSYLIDCRKGVDNLQALPDAPDIGWGPGPEAEDAGLEAKSHREAVVDATDGTAQVRFHTKHPLSVEHSLKHVTKDEWVLRDHVVARAEGDEVVLEVRLPEPGEYALNLYAAKENYHGLLENVCNYLIRCDASNAEHEPFPKIFTGNLGASYLTKHLDVAADESNSMHEISGDTHMIVINNPNNNMDLYCEFYNKEISDEILKDHVKRLSSDNNKTIFEFDFPKSGEYSANIYARKEAISACLYHIHSSMMVVKVEHEKDIQEKGVRNELQYVPIDTFKDLIKVALMVDQNKPLFACISRRLAHDAPVEDEIVSTTEEEEVRFSVKLQETGLYDLNVFEEQGPGILAQVGAYAIARYPQEYESLLTEDDSIPSEAETPVPQATKAKAKGKTKTKEARKLKKNGEGESEDKFKPYRERLRQAMASRDVQGIQLALKECKEAGLPDRRMMDKARKLLLYIQFSQELSQAMAERSLADLERVIKAVEAAFMDRQLGLQFGMAVRLRDQLRRLDNLRHDILKLENSTYSEIRSYAKPPLVVHRVMVATFILVGEPHRAVKEWTAVQALMGRTGKEGLRYRVGALHPAQVKMEHVITADDILSEFTLADARVVSAGAGTFYTWASSMIEEAKSRFAETGGDLEAIKRRCLEQQRKSSVGRRQVVRPR